MGKKERERKQAAREAQAFGTPRLPGRFSVTEVSEEDTRRVFLLEDCVLLTPEVIRDLVADGWSETKLQEFQQHGGQYCAPRDSIIFPEPKGLELMRDGENFLVHQHELAFMSKPVNTK